ncbi:MAG: hypothetical protein QOI82_1763 [Actinomycetota bacterium]|jgi:hypothetical protein|nr:hypothetical protein [Actinomycetota bacterium]
MAAEPAVDDQAATPAVVTGLDLLAGGAVLVVALLAWASLALAHIGRHSLPAVLAVTAVALLLVTFLVMRGSRGRVAVRGDLPGVLLAVACAGVAAALTFPGFSYGVADKDPGGYVTHAVEIAHHGDYGFTDPIVRDLPNQWQPTSPDAVFPGVWVRDASTGRIVPQFYHLWPALLATAYDIDGFDGLRFAVPLMGVLAVLGLVALLRRVGAAIAGPAAGLVAAGAGGLLLATNMLEVWQARYPTTEVLAEALYLGALLGVVVALQSRWRPAAGIAGLFVGIGWLNRPDGLLMVMLSVGIGAALLATRRWDARATWFAAGLAVVTPHALLQAYDLAHNYSIANSIPSLPKVVAVVVVFGVLGLILRLLARRPLTWATTALDRPRPQLVVGLLVCAGALALLAVGFLRSRLFGPDYLQYNGRPIRSYDEQILRRLSWFFTLPGFALMGLGLAAVALRRWRAAAWAVVVPTLVFFVVYGYTARNSSRLLWWSRRYVPTVLPGIVMLMALAIACAWVVRVRGRAVLRGPAVLALGGLVAVFLSQSLPVRRHDEWKGSFAVTQQLADLSGDKSGLYLWEPQGEQGCCAGPTALFATPVWLVHDGLSALLPGDHGRRAEIIALYAKHFPGRPVFIVGDTPDLPDGVDPSTVEPILTRHLELPMWDESDTSRPAGSHQVPVDIAVWHVRGT